MFSNRKRYFHLGLAILALSAHVAVASSAPQAKELTARYKSRAGADLSTFLRYRGLGSARSYRTGGGTGVVDWVDISKIDHSAHPEITLYVTVKDGNADPLKGLTASNFQLAEEILGRPADMQFVSFSVTDLSKTKSKADIVFIVDTTGSMSSEISAVKENIIAFTEHLVRNNVDYRLAGYSYGDEVPYRDFFDLNGDVGEFKEWVATLSASGGSDLPENPFDAMIDAASLDYRTDAQLAIVLITDISAHVAKDGGDSDTMATLAIVAAAIEGIPFYFSAPNNSEQQYVALEGTDLGEEFTSSTLIDILGREITDKYLVTYTSPYPDEGNLTRMVSVRASSPEAYDGAAATEIYVPSNAAIDYVVRGNVYNIGSTQRVHSDFSSGDDSSYYYPDGPDENGILTGYERASGVNVRILTFADELIGSGRTASSGGVEGVYRLTSIPADTYKVEVNDLSYYPRTFVLDLHTPSLWDSTWADVDISIETVSATDLVTVGQARATFMSEKLQTWGASVGLSSEPYKTISGQIDSWSFGLAATSNLDYERVNRMVAVQKIFLSGSRLAGDDINGINQNLNNLFLVLMDQSHKLRTTSAKLTTDFAAQSSFSALGSDVTAEVQLFAPQLLARITELPLEMINLVLLCSNALINDSFDGNAFSDILIDTAASYQHQFAPHSNSTVTAITAAVNSGLLLPRFASRAVATFDSAFVSVQGVSSATGTFADLLTTAESDQAQMEFSARALINYKNENRSRKAAHITMQSVIGLVKEVSTWSASSGSTENMATGLTLQHATLRAYSLVKPAASIGLAGGHLAVLNEDLHDASFPVAGIITEAVAARPAELAAGLITSRESNRSFVAISQPAIEALILSLYSLSQEISADKLQLAASRVASELVAVEASYTTSMVLAERVVIGSMGDTALSGATGIEQDQLWALFRNFSKTVPQVKISIADFYNRLLTFYVKTAAYASSSDSSYQEDKNRLLITIDSLIRQLQNESIALANVQTSIADLNLGASHAILYLRSVSVAPSAVQKTPETITLEVDISNSSATVAITVDDNVTASLILPAGYSEVEVTSAASVAVIVANGGTAKLSWTLRFSDQLFDGSLAVGIRVAGAGNLLPLGQEIRLLDVRSKDADGDGMDDAWELAYGLNTGADDSSQDQDNDNLSNHDEYLLGTDPTLADTDGDGLLDDQELLVGADPNLADTDGDGLGDSEEVRLGTDPTLADTDGDGFTDSKEVAAGTDPLLNSSNPDIAGFDTTGSTLGDGGDSGSTNTTSVGSSGSGPDNVSSGSCFVAGAAAGAFRLDLAEAILECWPTF